MTDRVFITGAAGFIGSNLVDNLLKTECQVMGIDNFDPYYDRKIKEQNIKNALQYPNFNFYEGDIRNAHFIESCFSDFKPDIIIHLAAKAGVRPSLVNPEAYYDVNVMGTLNLLEEMKKCKIFKMIFASSSSIYGNNMKIPFSESDNVDYPISPYAASKKAGELLCHTYHHLYNFDIYCLRFFTVYGPRQRPDLAIHKFTKALLNDKQITIYGDGSSCRDYTHIDDIIQGILKAIDKIKGFNIFNLGESTTVTLKNLVSILEKHTGGRAKVNYLPLQEGDVVQTFADISKARALLGYHPRTDIEVGVRDFVAWFLK